METVGVDDLRLARENAHPLDAHISFHEGRHEYTVDGDVISGSVSSLWGSRFEQFDAPGTARRCYPKWTQKAERGFEADVWTYTERYVRLMEGGDDAAVTAAGVPPGPVAVGEKGYSCLLKYLWTKGWGIERCVDAIVTLWSKLGEEASGRGTYIHLQCELHCNDEPYDERAVEVLQYLEFRAQHPNLTPYRSEWSVFARLGLYTITGQIDAIFKNTDDDTFVMVDYKCTAHELTPANPFGRCGTYPFEAVPDTPWGHYVCQQNIYRYVLENFYDVHLSYCKLLRVHSTIDEFELVDVPDLQAEVGLLFEELRSITLRPNLKFPLTDPLKMTLDHPLKISGTFLSDQHETVPKRYKRSRIARVFAIILNAVKFILRLRKKTNITNSSNMALSLQNAVSQMNIVCVPQVRLPLF